MKYGLALPTLLVTLGVMAVWFAVVYVEQGIPMWEVLDAVWFTDLRTSFEYIISLLSSGSFLLILVSTMCANLVVCCIALVMERVIFKSLRRSELEFSIQTSLDFVVSRSLAIYAGNKVDGGPPTYMWLGWGILCGWANALHAMAHARLQYSLSVGNDGEARKVLAIITVTWIVALTLLLTCDVASDAASIGWQFLWAYDVILLTFKTAHTFGEYFIDVLSQGTSKTVRKGVLGVVVDILTCLLTIYMCTTVLVMNGFAWGVIDLLSVVRGRYPSIRPHRHVHVHVYLFKYKYVKRGRVSFSVFLFLFWFRNNVDRLRRSSLCFISHFRLRSSFSTAYKRVKVNDSNATDESGGADAMCSICHDVFTRYKYKLRSCGHSFHLVSCCFFLSFIFMTFDNKLLCLVFVAFLCTKECLDQWLERSLTCPLCRQEAIQPSNSSQVFDRYLLTPFAPLLEGRRNDVNVQA
eukprot:m.25283 g.25283  ORF g.25283 m.25283 type:complete len:465 (-) comp9187_c0_seq4:177-1571(-)